MKRASSRGGALRCCFLPTFDGTDIVLGEPTPTQADLHFSIFGIPVRVHPFFWFVAILLGLRGTDGDPVLLLVWVVAVFLSILIHELGHALTAKSFGERPWITLYSFGGLASYHPTRHDTRSRVLVLLAGPGAGFLFLALVLAGVHAAGHSVSFFVPQGWFLPVATWEPFEQDRANRFIWDLFQINLFWGLANLIPVYPLDGGQVARELWVRFDRHDGIRKSLYLSIFSGAAMAVFGAVAVNSLLLAIMFGFFAYNSYQLLQQYQGGGGGGWGGPRGW